MLNSLCKQLLIVCQRERSMVRRITCLSILMWYTLSLYETFVKEFPDLHPHTNTLVFVQAPVVSKLIVLHFSAHGTYEFHSRNMIKPSGLSGNFFHEFLVCCFVMGTVHKCNQAIKHLIKRGGALHDHGILQLTVAALKVIVCCVSKVYKLVSLIRHSHVSASVPCSSK